MSFVVELTYEEQHLHLLESIESVQRLTTKIR